MGNEVQYRSEEERIALAEGGAIVRDNFDERNGLTKDNFRDAVSKGIVLVDWWSPLCVPCIGFTHSLRVVSEEHPDVTFVKVDVRAEPELAEEFDIELLPTITIFKDGEQIHHKGGSVSTTRLHALLEKAKS